MVSSLSLRKEEVDVEYSKFHYPRLTRNITQSTGNALEMVPEDQERTLTSLTIQSCNVVRYICWKLFDNFWWCFGSHWRPIVHTPPEYYARALCFTIVLESSSLHSSPPSKYFESLHSTIRYNNKFHMGVNRPLHVL